MTRLRNVKPCPFCGGRNVVFVSNREVEDSIVCCQSRRHCVMIFAKSVKEAREVWQARIAAKRGGTT